VSAIIDPTAVIDEGAQLGDGTRVWHFSHVRGTAVIGDNCILGQNVYIDNRVTVGNKVKIQNNVSVYEGVTLEDEVFCGPSMVFTNVINPRSGVERKHEFRRTLVRRGATFGANCTVVCGISVGEYAFVGAGAVVTKAVPAYALMTGVPARQTGWMCRCGVKLPAGEAPVCAACGAAYRQDGTVLHPC